MAGKPEFQSLPKTIVAWKQDDLGFFQGGQQGHRSHHGDADCLLQGMPSTKDLVPVHQQ